MTTTTVPDATEYTIGTVIMGPFGAHAAIQGPKDIAFDSSGNMYVTEGSIGLRVLKFDASFNFLGWYGKDNTFGAGFHTAASGATTPSGGTGDLEFSGCVGIHVEGSTIYVVDSVNYRVQVFQTDATYTGWWGSDTVMGNGWHAPGTANSPAASLTDYGFSAAQFVDVSPLNDYLYVSDNVGRVQVFNRTTKNVIGWFGFGGIVPGQWYPPGSPQSPTSNSCNGCILNGRGLGIVSNGNVYVGQQGAHNVKIFDASGVEITTFGGGGSTDLLFFDTWGVKVIQNDYILVSDWNNHRVKKYLSTTMLGWWGRDQFQGIGWHLPGTATNPLSDIAVGAFNRPESMNISPVTGQLVVADTSNNRLVVYNPN